MSKKLKVRFNSMTPSFLGRIMSDLKRAERLQIMLSEVELEALDAWRFARHMPSRAAAIRELLKRGLAAEGVHIGNARTKSGEYGVLTGPASKASQKG